MDSRYNDGLRMFFMLILAACVALGSAACDNGGGKKTEKNCTDTLDNDGDGLTDCDDADCVTDAACQAQDEICDNDLDDDGDTLVDCDDDDCAEDVACLTPTEICDDTIDNDDDTLVDCDDPDCDGDPACPADVEICDDTIDNDDDTLVDCDDPDCDGDPACPADVEICDDTIDNDDDTLVDCDDPDCDGDPACPADVEICDDTIDNDGDDLIDCADDDCADAANCIESDCADTVDNDLDGDTDCDDSDCAAAANCYESDCADTVDNDLDGDTDCDDSECAAAANCYESDCADTVDNDLDGDTDCDDSECFGQPACQTSGEDVCDDNIDNDSDGATDCDDTECAAEPNCLPPVEICDNDVDDDGDGDTDCDDEDCLGQPACQTSGEDVCDDNIDNDADGATDCDDTECAAENHCWPEVDCADTIDNDDDGLTDCDDGDCAQAANCQGCPDDQYEPNEDLASAAPLTAGSYSLYGCNENDDQEDWFSVDLAAGETIAVAIDFVDADLDFDISLRNASNTTLDSSSLGGVDHEEVSYTSTAGETVYIRVFPFDTAAAPYAMLIVIDPPCTVDGDCQLGEICTGFACVAGCRIDSGCPDGEICEQNSCVTGCRADGDCLAGEVCFDTQCITPECLQHQDCGVGQVCADYYCVDLSCDATTDPCPDYDMVCDTGSGTCVECLSATDCPNEVDFVCTDGWCDLNCAEDSYEPNSLANMPYAISTLPFSETNLTLCGLNDDDWFSLDLAADHVYTIDLAFLSADGDIDLYLVDGDDTVVAESEFGTDGEHIVFRVPTDGAGTYRVLVHLYSSGIYTHTYDMDITDLGAAECNDHPECSSGEICQDYMCVAFSCDATNICPDGLFCSAGACVGCATVDDCPDSTYYTCTNNFCVFECDEDSYEPNSDAASAAAISLPFNETELTLCGDRDYDWFAVTLTENQVYRFDIYFIDADGDVDLHLYRAGNTSSSVASSASVTDNEGFTYLVPAGATDTYLVRVYDWSTGVLYQTYDMTIVDLGAAECSSDTDCGADQVCVGYVCNDCPPDAYEPNGDDQSAAAASLPLSESGLTLCGEDAEDWFAVDLSADTIYTIDTLFTHADGNISLYLYAPGYSDLYDYDASSLSSTDDEQIVYAAQVDGTYLVRVRLYAGDMQTYDLSIQQTGTVECWAHGDCSANQFCIDYGCTDCLPDMYEPNGDAASAASVSLPLNASRLTLCGSLAADWFQVTLAENTIYTIDAAFIHAQGNISLYLYPAGSSSSVASSTSSTDDEHITYAVPAGAGGLYNIRVYLSSGTMQEYDLAVASAGAVQCVEHLDCRQGEICEDYQCLTFACDASNPCPSGLLCDTGAAWCVECLASTDCPNDIDFTCVGNYCELDCLEDGYEPNSVVGDAYRVTGLPFSDTGLTLCGEYDEDWFEVTLTENTVYAFDSYFIDADGDINMRLYRENFTSLTNYVASGTSYTDDETFTYAVPAGQGGIYYLRIYAYSYDYYTQTYDLSIQDLSAVECTEHTDCNPGEICDTYQCVAYACDGANPCPTDLVCDDTSGYCVECVDVTDCPNDTDFTCVANVCVLDCTEDIYEPNSDSGSAVALTSLPVSETGLTLCGYHDHDWFTVDATEGQAIGVNLYFIDADGDVDLRLYRAGNLSSTVASSGSVTDNESISYTVPSGATDTYYIEVYLYSGYTQTYDMDAAVQ